MPYRESACDIATKELGMKGPKEASSYSTKGCYYYKSGKWAGTMYFGTGGTPSQHKQSLDGGKSRPEEIDCKTSKAE